MVIQMLSKMIVMIGHYALRYGFAALLLACMSATAAPTAEVAPYRIQPGDVLVVSVWKESDLQSEVLVRPDGGLSLPLAGEFQAAGHSIEELRSAIAQKLEKYVPNAVVTVAVKQIGGNRVYVIGKVNRPGEFMFSKPIDVMQALSLAGGATPFAALNDIRILRRDEQGQQAIAFRYGDVESGHKLEQNILLHSGDTVVVP
ncbi:MAG TPA: polysaccharide biosynthesis/export family protein [Povalibacter sp.]|nr:polysaccharide biosynthesis/export family protein [Povalibacter sp.]